MHLARRRPGTAAARTRPSTQRHARGSSGDGASETLLQEICGGTSAVGYQRSHRRAVIRVLAGQGVSGPSRGSRPGGDAARLHGPRLARGVHSIRQPAPFKLSASVCRVTCASRGLPHVCWVRGCRQTGAERSCWALGGASERGEQSVDRYQGPTTRRACHIAAESCPNTSTTTTQHLNPDLLAWLIQGEGPGASGTPADTLRPRSMIGCLAWPCQLIVARAAGTEIRSRTRGQACGQRG